MRTALSIILAFICHAAGQTTIYVNGACGNDAWSGLSEVCAAPDGPKKTIRAGIEASSGSDLVLIAPGVYKGRGNVGINLSSLNYGANLRGSGGSEVTIIDGEGITFGIDGTDSNVYLEGLTFRNCYLPFPGSGAAVIVHHGYCLARACRFEHNYAGRDGGAILSWVSLVQIDNCVFIGNRAQENGGALYGAGHFHVANSTFVDNDAVLVGDAADGYGEFKATNCIFRGSTQQIGFGSPEVKFSCVEGGFPGTGNIHLDPEFVNSATGDYRLNPGSPCIDAGNNEGRAGRRDIRCCRPAALSRRPRHARHRSRYSTDRGHGRLRVPGRFSVRGGL